MGRRDRDVVALVVRGKFDKQIGAELATSEITVKADRARVIRKMQAKSVAELVNAAMRLRPPTGGKR